MGWSDSCRNRKGNVTHMMRTRLQSTFALTHLHWMSWKGTSWLHPSDIPTLFSDSCSSRCQTNSSSYFFWLTQTFFSCHKVVLVCWCCHNFVGDQVANVVWWCRGVGWIPAGDFWRQLQKRKTLKIFENSPQKFLKILPQNSLKIRSENPWKFTLKNPWKFAGKISQNFKVGEIEISVATHLH